MIEQPPIFNNDDFDCYDYEWFWADSLGQVAGFTTSGQGYTPNAYARIQVEYEDLSDLILTVPKSTRTIVLPDPAKSAKFLKPKFHTHDFAYDITKRGLFCYDLKEDNVLDPEYTLIAKPGKPVLLKHFPKKFVEAVSGFQYFPGVFGKADICPIRAMGKSCRRIPVVGEKARPRIDLG